MCALLVTKHPVAVVVVVVVACACKFVNVSIKGGVHVAAGAFVPFLPSITIVDIGGVPFSAEAVFTIVGCAGACGRLRLCSFPCDC